MKSIPEEPRFGANVSETKLFEAFTGKASSKPWTLVHSVQIGRDPDVLAGEADFFVLVPGAGIVAIEAKSPTQVTYKNGDWFLEGTPKPKKSPLDQASRARAAMRKFISEIGIDSEIPIARLVWFTSLGRHQFDPVSKGDFQFLEWELAWKQDLDKPAEAIERVLESFLKHHSGSTILQYEPSQFTSELVDKIANSIFADFSVSQDPRDLAKDRANERAQLIKEQFEILDALEDNRHIYLEGSAGTGKSFLIAEAATRSRSAGKRTLVTCWNILMAEELSRQMPHSADINFVVQDINAIMLSFAGLSENPEGSGSSWYEVELPKLALAGLNRQPFLGNFSSIFIDEFQDLVGKFHVLNFIFSLSKNKKITDTTIVLAGDERQQILVDAKGEIGAYATAKTLIPDLTKFKLRANTRMTPKLHQDMTSLLGLDLGVTKHRQSKDKTGGLFVVESKGGRQTKHLVATLKELLSSYDAEDIRVLSPFGAQSSLVGKIFQSDPKSPDDRWLAANMRHASSSGKIRWRSIAKFKGLESEVVVITDVGNEAAEFFASRGQSAQDWLYVGISRARHRCVILSDGEIQSLFRDTLS